MLSDIKHVVPNKTPYSLKDTFNPLVNTKLTRIIATAALALVIIFSVATCNYIKSARYGSMSHLTNATIYEHYDLIVGFNTSWKISLLGHSAFSDGYYSAESNNINGLRTFIKSHKKDFSVKQNK